jgi:hypothetical protein
MNDLQSLMALLAEKWFCTTERYPELALLDSAQRRNFRLKHSVLHITKTAGKLAAVCEAFDHRGTSRIGAEDALQIECIAMFNNALNLAREAGLSASDLLARAPLYVK